MPKIPFYDTICTKDNFSKIKDYENFNLKIKRETNYILISFKQTYATAFYSYFDKSNNLYTSLNEEKLYEYIKTNNLEPSIDKCEKYKEWENKKLTNKQNWSIQQLCTNKYTHITSTKKLYKYIKVYIDNFHVEYYTTDEIDKMLEPVCLEEAKDIFMTWLNKYQKCIDDIAVNKKEKLIVELSGGYDTRALTYFWYGNKYLKNDYYVYTKNDETELPIVRELFEVLNIPKENILYSKKGVNGITLSGVGNPYNESTTYDMMDIHINFACYWTSKHMIKDIVPFLDKDYMKIQQKYTCELKNFLNVLLCENLCGVLYRTNANVKRYITEYEIRKCKEVIKKWGLNIKNGKIED